MNRDGVLCYRAVWLDTGQTAANQMACFEDLNTRWT